MVFTYIPQNIKKPKRYVIKILRYLCIVAVFTELLKKHNVYMIHSIISVFQKIRMTKLLQNTRKKERKKEHEINKIKHYAIVSFQF